MSEGNMAGEGEKPDALQVQHADHVAGHGQHHKEMHVVPIEEEALEDAYHIDLTWRSWVRLFSTYVRNKLILVF